MLAPAFQSTERPRKPLREGQPAGGPGKLLIWAPGRLLPSQVKGLCCAFFNEGLKQAPLPSLVCLTLESRGWGPLSVVEPEVSEPTSPSAGSLGSAFCWLPTSLPCCFLTGVQGGHLPRQLWSLTTCSLLFILLITII